MAEKPGLIVMGGSPGQQRLAPIKWEMETFVRNFSPKIAARGGLKTAVS
jgi:hypothetical protein